MELWELFDRGDMEQVKKLIASRCDEYGQTLLHYAVYYGNLEIVAMLTESGVNVNIPDGEGSTLLVEAISEGHRQIAMLLLEKGADPNTGRNCNGTVLHAAARTGDVIVGRCLLEKGANVNAIDNEADRNTPLHCAARCNQLELVKLLLQHGADIYAVSGLSWPMDEALDKGHKEVAEYLYLVVEKVYPDVLGSPFHAAAGLRNVDLMSRFINGKYAVDVQDYQKRTPLHWAVGRDRLLFFQIILEQSDALNDAELFSEYKRGNCREAIEYLLANGSDIEAKDYANNTPLLIAMQWGQTDAAEVLINHGADVNATDVTGWTPLILAASGGRLELLKRLLQRGANISAVRDGWNVLNQACHMGKENIVRFLLDYGMDVNGPRQRATFSYPLLSAVFMGHVSIIKLLIDNGADTTIQDAAGNTALSLARGNKKIIKLLKG